MSVDAYTEDAPGTEGTSLAYLVSLIALERLTAARFTLAGRREDDLPGAWLTDHSQQRRPRRSTTTRWLPRRRRKASLRRRRAP